MWNAFVRHIWEPVIAEPFRRVEAESRAHMASEGSARADGKLIAVFVVAALCLTLLDYYGMLNRTYSVAQVLQAVGLDGWATAFTVYVREPINGLTFWSLACFTCYFVIPALVIKLAFREKLSDYGLGFRGAGAGAPIYIVFFGVMFPLLFLVSKGAHFQQTYPFYDLGADEALWPNMIRWELLYALQFFALEFFFRGFLVHGTRHRLGWYSVLAMMVPYCMIHYGKPLPETVGAIIAGVALGSLSLKTRSIWLGVAIHVSVAWSMDFLSLWRKGLL